MNFLNIKQAAETLRVSPARIRAMVRSGALPAVVMGPRSIRIAEADLMRLASKPAEARQ